MIFVSETDMAEIAPRLFDDLITALGQAFADQANGSAANVPRRRSTLPGGLRLQEMAGSFSWHGTSYIGTKTYASSASFRKAPSVVQLYDTGAGEVAAVIEAKTLGAWRTAAASALVIRQLSKAGSATAAIFGSGGLAAWHLHGLLKVRPDIRLVQVWSRDAQRAADFCGREGASTEAELVPIAQPGQVVKDVDVVITVTKSAVPLVSLDTVAAHTHVSAVGANQPQKRELDAGLVAAAKVIYVDDVIQARKEAGDLLAAEAETSYEWSNVRPVHELFSDETTPADGVTIFESQGIGLEDVVAGALAYEYITARDRGPITAAANR